MFWHALGQRPGEFLMLFHMFYDIFGICLASACGRPPAFVDSIRGAELWAVQIATSLAESSTSFRTDCESVRQGVIAGAKVGLQQQAEVCQHLGPIVTNLDDASSDALVWMPAHTRTSSVVEVKLSNGARLSMANWTANRLFHALVKMAAVRQLVLSRG